MLMGAVAQVRKAIRSGATDLDRVTARLEAEDLSFLEEKVEATRWYPVGTLGRYLEVLASLSPGPRDETLYKLGELSLMVAQRSGSYPQLRNEGKRADQNDPSERRLMLRMRMSVWSAFYSFGSFKIEVDPEGKPAIEYVDVGPLPDAIRPTIEGFMAAITSDLDGRPVRVTSERPTPDRIVLHQEYV